MLLAGAPKGVDSVDKLCIGVNFSSPLSVMNVVS